MAAQVAPAQKEAAPKLTRQKTKEIFLDSEEKKMDSMKSIMQNRSADPMEQMFEMMIEQARLADEMFFSEGIEEEDFNAAMMQFNLMHDPEVQRTVMMNMQKLGMGGMGGMGGGGMY